MPDPARLVARSISLLRRLGLSEREACLTVYQVANALHWRMASDGEQPNPWLVDVGHAVLERLARLPRHDQAVKGAGDGDRGGGGAGSPESTAG